MDYQVCTTEQADLEGLSILFDEYLQFYGKTLAMPDIQVFLSARLTQQDSVIFVAKDAQGSVIGFLQLYPSFSSLDLAPIFILNDVYVTQHARCVGVGRKLMEAAIEHGRRGQVAYLCLETQHANLRAQGLYQALGFNKDTEFATYTLDIQRSLK